MTREEIAREALEDIASRGVAKPVGLDRFCILCKHEQQSYGICLNRDCPTWIARTALEAMRTAP